MAEQGEGQQARPEKRSPRAVFKPLKEFGTISVSPTTDIKFYADAYRGHTYVSMRNFLKSGDYVGPTKAGVTLTAEIIDGITAALRRLPKDPAALKEEELARFKRRSGAEVVVRVALFREAFGVDIREWIDDADYKGWSKKGVRIPLPAVEESLGCLDAMRAFLKETSKVS